MLSKILQIASFPPPNKNHVVSGKHNIHINILCDNTASTHTLTPSLTIADLDIFKPHG